MFINKLNHVMPVFQIYDAHKLIKFIKFLLYKEQDSWYVNSNQSVKQ